MHRIGEKILLLFLLGVFSLSCGGRPPGPGNFESVRRDPAKAKGHLGMGATHLREGRITQALKELLMAEQYDPENADVQHHLGVAYQYKLRLKQAETHVKRALALRKDFPEAHNTLGGIYTTMKRYDEALTQFNLALSNVLYLTPQYAHYNIGLVYFEQERYEQALPGFQKAVDLAPTWSFAYYHIGRCYHALKRLEEAREAFEKAVRYASNYALAHFYLAEVYLELNQPEKARENYNKVIKIAPTHKLSEQARKRLTTITNR